VSACTPAGPRPSVDARFEADLLAIADAYPALTRADGTWWAPEDCRAPTHPTFLSMATSGAHGRKLYTLFVKDYASYSALSGWPVDAGVSFFRRDSKLEAMPQVIVKEAWTPVESSAWQEKCASRGMPNYLAEVTMEGKPHRACEQAGLFIMYRAPAGTAGTDEGWVYGTVQYDQIPDPRPGQSSYVPRVTAAGRVESCMGCHTKAPHGRLLGLAVKK
jgi:hypothetical protein